MAVGHHRADARQQRLGRPGEPPAVDAPSCTCSARSRTCRRASPTSRWPAPRGRRAAGGEEQIRELARGVNQLVTQMRAEQKVVREWVDEQAAQQSEVANALKELATNMQRRG